MRIVIYHSSYGCDTGCCGHILQVDGRSQGGFNFGHPYDEDYRAWAEDWVRQEFGEEHIADLDWDNCRVISD